MLSVHDLVAPREAQLLCGSMHESNRDLVLLNCASDRVVSERQAGCMRESTASSRGFHYGVGLYVLELWL